MDKLKDKPPPLESIPSSNNDSATMMNNNGSVKPKEKRRSNEKRKEKSRDAARCRRSRETEIFSELGQVLPLRREDVEQLDKASIMRLSIAFLKVRNMLKLFPQIKDLQIINKNESNDQNEITEELKPFDSFNKAENYKAFGQALDGFLLILSSDGDVTYVSDNISEYLGISQIDILGQQIWEYSHQCDHEELKEALNIRKNGHHDKIELKTEKSDAKSVENGEKITTVHRDFFLRLKCTLTSRGRSINIKSASYKVIHFTGHMVTDAKGESILIGIGRPLPHPSNIEIPLGSTTFLTKHSLDMKFTYVDDKMLSLLGYRPEDLLGKSLYECHHGGDSESLMTTFKSVISKGQGETCRYRFLGKTGGYCWILTQATIVYDKQKPQSVVCVNYVISDLENKSEIYSCAQLEAYRKEENELGSCKSPSGIREGPAATEKEKRKQEFQENQKQRDNIILLRTPEKVIENNNNNCKSPIILQQQQQQRQNFKFNCAIDTDNYKVNINKSDNNNPIDNFSVNKTADIKRNNYRETSLSPIRHTFNNCSISSNPTIVGVNPKVVTPIASVFNNNNNNSNNNNNNNNNNINSISQNEDNNTTSELSSKPVKFIQKSENRPKSVTASVFTQVCVPDSSGLPRSQSVTASVFTTLAALRKLPSKVLLTPNNGNNPGVNSLQQQQLQKQLQQLLQQQKLQQQQQEQQEQQQQQQSSISKIRNNLIRRSRFSSSILHKQRQERRIQRAEDMNKGFLSFPDETSDLTMLKEEPDDLTHLAPTPGDTCIPLDESTPLFGEMLEGLILPDTYTLLPDDIASLDSQNSNNNSSNGCNNNSSKNSIDLDPFINYRDESSDTNSSPHLLSPGGASKSPEVSSLPSLCSPNSLSQEDEFAFMTMNDDIDLTMRAPYIPMNEQEDLPLLTDDLMWSAFSEELTLHKEVKDALQLQSTTSSLTNIKNTANCNKNNLNIINNKNDIFYNNSNTNSNNDNINIKCGGSTIIENNINFNQQQQQMLSRNNNNNNNNNNNSDQSSLAALLCGGHNNKSSNNNNDCGLKQQLLISSQDLMGSEDKKRKFDQLTDNNNSNCSNEEPTNLVDAIESYGETFNTKDSSNDCWTMNDLLQLNSGLQDNNNSGCLPDRNQQQQNIIVSTAQIQSMQPLLATIQKNEYNHQNCLNSRNSSPAFIIHQGNNNTAAGKFSNGIDRIDGGRLSDELGNMNNNDNNISNDANIGLCVNTNSIDDSMNRKYTTKILNSFSPNIIIKNITPGTTVTSSRLNNNSNSKDMNSNNYAVGDLLSISSMNGGISSSNKRHLNSTSNLDIKRLKNSPKSELQTSSQLLQQLITAPPHHQQQQQHQQLQQQSQQNEQQQMKQKVKLPLFDQGSNSKWYGNSDSDGGGTIMLNGNVISRGMNNSTGPNINSSSNSVLKNLLVSGCDISFPPLQSPEMACTMSDDSSRDSLQLQDHGARKLISPNSMGMNMYNSRPLYCKVMPSSPLSSPVMTNCCSNPLIGGASMLPSPPILTAPSPAGTDDSSPPGLIGMYDTDSGSDSGIECSNNMRQYKFYGDKSSGFLPTTKTNNFENITNKGKPFILTPRTTPLSSLPQSPTTIPGSPSTYIEDKQMIVDDDDEHHYCRNVHHQRSDISNIVGNNDNNNLTFQFSEGVNLQRIDDPPPSVNDSALSTPSPLLLDDKRKMSFSFLDNDNPLYSSFLMDLCNDDYNMTDSDFLQDSELTKVLNELTSEMS